MPEVVGPNIFGSYLAGRQAYQGEQQQQFQNQLAQRQAQMQEAEFQQQQERIAREQQFNQLAGQFLGQGDVDAAGGLPTGGGDPSAAAAAAGIPGAPQQPQQAPRTSFAQLAALDPARAFQMQQAMYQQHQQQQQEQADQARQIVTRAQYALKSHAPATLLKVGFPDFAKQLSEQGVDVDALSDDDVRGYAQTLIEHFGPIAGIGPAGPGEQFTLGEGQKRFDSAGHEIASVEKQPSADDGRNDRNDRFNRANTLRDEFNAITQDFGTVKSSLGTIEATAKNPSAAGDISLITAYMKMLDPTSSVKEGEFNTAQYAASVPQRLMGAYNKILSGQRLTEDQRADFIGQAKNIFNSRQTQYKSSREKYRQLATKTDVDPTLVVGEDDGAPAPASQAERRPAAKPKESGPRVGVVEGGYRFKGGNPADPSSWEKV